MRWWLAWVLPCFACGRLGFGTGGDRVDASGIANDGANGDGVNGDSGPSACLSNPAYTTLAQLTHRYRLLQSGNLAWTTARDTCAADGAYLVILDNATEAAAIDTDWIGITDVANEGVWLTLKGTAAPYLPWGPSEPSGGLTKNCGRWDNSAIEARECTDTRNYGCECE